MFIKYSNICRNKEVRFHVLPSVCIFYDAYFMDDVASYGIIFSWLTMELEVSI